MVMISGNAVGEYAMVTVMPRLYPLRAWPLRWMPLVGECEYYCNRRRLKARRREDVIREWQVVSVPAGFVDRVSVMVAEIIGWPNPFFIPHDDCVAILFPSGDINMDFVELAIQLQEELSLDGCKWQSVESVITARGKYVEFVTALHSKISP